MRQTTSGEIRRNIKFHERKEVEEFLENNLDEYFSLKKMKNCLYENLIEIDDFALNYINTIGHKKVNRQLKCLIKKEFDKLEKIYPYLGNIFLESYFSDTHVHVQDTDIFSKDDVKNFIDSLSFEENKEICKIIFEKASLEYTVNVESVFGNDIVVKKSKDIDFKINYDFSFLGSKSNHTMKDYNFIIIDGMIETVGEIHHLLFEASQNKKPYVIFCFGLSPEVKNVIIENNKRGITEVFPVSITFDENTINILNDIAFLHKSEIVSSQKGQTISQAVRKKLDMGNKIIFSKTGFKLVPVASYASIVNHREFLQKRMRESGNLKNYEVISKRLKRMTDKNLKIFIPDKLLNQIGFLRELDYILRFIRSTSKNMGIIEKNTFKSIYYLPVSCVELVNKSKDSLKNTFNSIEGLILYEGE